MPPMLTFSMGRCSFMENHPRLRRMDFLACQPTLDALAAIACLGRHGARLWHLGARCAGPGASGAALPGHRPGVCTPSVPDEC